MTYSVLPTKARTVQRAYTRTDYEAVALAAGVVVGVARLLFSAEWSGHGAPVGALLVVLCGLRLLWVMDRGERA